MLASEHGEFQVVIRKLAGVFDRAINAELMEAYWDALRDVPLTALRSRADACIRDGKFFPKPAELRQRRDGEPRPTPPNTLEPLPAGDEWDVRTNACLLEVLLESCWKRRAVADDRLPGLIAYKRRIATEMRGAEVSTADWNDGIRQNVTAEMRRMAA